MTIKVLIVDNEPTIVTAISMKLRNAGFEVVCAQDIEEGLSVAASELPDFIIMDCSMPALDVHTLCRRLHEKQSTRQIMLMAITSRLQYFAPQEGARLGMLEIISKPFLPRELLEATRLIIARYLPRYQLSPLS